eukprot:6000751-Ditylum_brightwellii.AAC.1
MKRGSSWYEAKLASLTEEKRAKAPPFQLMQPSMAGALIKGFGRWAIAFAFLYNLLSSLLAFVPVHNRSCHPCGIDTTMVSKIIHMIPMDCKVMILRVRMWSGSFPQMVFSKM